MPRKTKHEIEVGHLEALLRIEKEYNAQLLELLSEAPTAVSEEASLTIPSAAKALAIKPTVLYKAGLAGKLQTFRRDKSVFTTQSAVNEWVKKR